MPQFDPHDWVTLGTIIAGIGGHDRLMQLGALRDSVASNGIFQLDAFDRHVPCEKDSEARLRAVRLIEGVADFETSSNPSDDDGVHPLDSCAGDPDDPFVLFGWPANQVSKVLPGTPLLGPPASEHARLELMPIERAVPPESPAPEQGHLLTLRPVERIPPTEPLAAEYVSPAPPAPQPELQEGDQLMMLGVLMAVLTIRKINPNARNSTSVVRAAVDRLSGRKMDKGNVHSQLIEAWKLHRGMGDTIEKKDTSRSSHLIIGVLASEAIDRPPWLDLPERVTYLVQRFGLCASVETVRSVLGSGAEELANTREGNSAELAARAARTGRR